MATGKPEETISILKHLVLLQPRLAAFPVFSFLREPHLRPQHSQVFLISKSCLPKTCLMVRTERKVNPSSKDQAPVLLSRAALPFPHCFECSFWISPASHRQCRMRFSRQPAPLPRTGPGVSGQHILDLSGKYSYWCLRWAYSPGTQIWNGSLNACFALGQVVSLQSRSAGCKEARGHSVKFTEGTWMLAGTWSTPC